MGPRRVPVRLRAAPLPPQLRAAPPGGTGRAMRRARTGEGTTGLGRGGAGDGEAAGEDL